MIKWLLAFFCLCMVKSGFSQNTAVSCNVQTTYTVDGRLTKFVGYQTIDSTKDMVTSLGAELTGSYYYITIRVVYKTAVKTVVGDLVIQFSDNTSMNVPLTNCNSNGAGIFESTTCSYIVLDKFIRPLTIKSIDKIIFRMIDNTFKAIDLKTKSTLLKDALTCLMQ